KTGKPNGRKVSNGSRINKRKSKLCSSKLKPIANGSKSVLTASWSPRTTRSSSPSSRKPGNNCDPSNVQPTISRNTTHRSKPKPPGIGKLSNVQRASPSSSMMPKQKSPSYVKT